MMLFHDTNKHLAKARIMPEICCNLIKVSNSFVVSKKKSNALLHAVNLICISITVIHLNYAVYLFKDIFWYVSKYLK